jgi:hypothetical protein
MRKPATGEPCAGEPHARFGGRGGQPSRPLSRGCVALQRFWILVRFEKRRDDLGDPGDIHREGQEGA